MSSSASSSPPSSHHHRGICTGWLEDVCNVSKFITAPSTAHTLYTAATDIPGVKWNADNTIPYIPIFIKRASDFALPSDVSVPVIMVGAGTGVAPFRGFLQHRAHQQQALKCGGTCSGWWRGMEMELEEGEGEVVTSPSRYVHAGNNPVSTAIVKPDSNANGKMVLFFGCRNRNHDFLYQQELDEAHITGPLTHFFVAFSRADASEAIKNNNNNAKTYVQHRIQEQGALVASLMLHSNAMLYVCGDGAGMARDVMASVEQVLTAHGGMTAAAAKQQIFGWMKAKRYVQDIWS